MSITQNIKEVIAKKKVDIAKKRAERKIISDAKKEAYSQYKQEKAKSDFEAKLEKAKTLPYDRKQRRKQRQEALKNKVKDIGTAIKKKMNQPRAKGKASKAKMPDFSGMMSGGMNFAGSNQSKQKDKPMKFGNPLKEFDKPKKQKKHNPNSWY